MSPPTLPRPTPLAERGDNHRAAIPSLTEVGRDRLEAAGSGSRYAATRRRDIRPQSGSVMPSGAPTDRAGLLTVEVRPLASRRCRRRCRLMGPQPCSTALRGRVGPAPRAAWPAIAAAIVATRGTLTGSRGAGNDSLTAAGAAGGRGRSPCRRPASRMCAAAWGRGASGSVDHRTGGPRPLLPGVCGRRRRSSPSSSAGRPVGPGQDKGRAGRNLPGFFPGSGWRRRAEGRRHRASCVGFTHRGFSSARPVLRCRCRGTGRSLPRRSSLPV